MNRFIAPAMLLGALWLASPASLAVEANYDGLTRPEVGPDNVPINQDYFRSDISRRLRKLLYEVETYHLHEPVMDSLRGGNYHRVIQDMEYCLRKFPNHPKALMLLSSATRLRGAPEYAFTFFEHAIQLYPNYGLTHAQYGHHLMESGALDAAILELEDAVKIDPALTQAYGWLAEAYEMRGDHELARETARKARVGPPKPSNAGG